MRPLILEAGAIAAAEVTILKTDVVGPGQIFNCLAAMAMDETTQIATRIEIGIFSGTRLIPIDATAGAFAAGVSHTIYWPFAIPAGCGVYAKFVTPTAGDQLRLVATGVVGPVADINRDRFMGDRAADHPLRRI